MSSFHLSPGRWGCQNGLKRGNPGSIWPKWGQSLASDPIDWAMACREKCKNLLRIYLDTAFHTRGRVAYGQVCNKQIT